MADNLELNQLLEIARQAQKELNEWPYSTDKPMPRRTQQRWTALHAAMLLNLPVSIRLATGGVRAVRTMGSLTEHLLLFYSEMPNAEYCMEAVDLQLVVSIEKVEQ